MCKKEIVQMRTWLWMLFLCRCQRRSWLLEWNGPLGDLCHIHEDFEDDLFVSYVLSEVPIITITVGYTCLCDFLKESGGSML